MISANALAFNRTGSMSFPKSNRKRLAPVERAVERCLRLHVRPGERLLVAVSGGADSLALILALEAVSGRANVGLVVVCVDHGLRAGSAEEASRVATWAERRGLAARTVSVSVGRDGGLEAAARHARYAALEQVATELGAAWIATGHSASDQAETVLLRLARGAGARGARGVLEVRGRVLRPLIALTRPEILAYLASRGETPLVEDPSNLDLARARNRIRHRVLPELRQALGPGADRCLARFALLARDDEAALSGWADRTPNDRVALQQLPAAVARRWLRRLCESRGYRPSAAELEALRRALRGTQTRQLELGRAWRVSFGQKTLSIAASQEPERVAAVSLAKGRVGLPWAGLTLELRTSDGAHGPLILKLPPDVALPLLVRQVAPGDRIDGERGTIRVKRLLIDRKVPRSERSRIPVVTDAHGKVLWVVGHRVAAALHGQPTHSGGWILEASTLLGSRPLKRPAARPVIKKARPRRALK
jgi:tRNA(Ile)-lysidine synthase